VLGWLAAPGQADVPKRFFQFNTCGSVTTNPDCTAHGDVDTVASAVVSSILDFQPHAVSLNEICKSQFDEIVRRLSSSSWPMSGAQWAWQKNTANNCANNDFGLGVLTKPATVGTAVIQSISDTSATDPPDDSENRKIVCVSANFERTTKVCTTHITNSDQTNSAGTSYRAAQIQRLAGVVNPWVTNGTPVALMGDFNVEPTWNALDPIYDKAIFGGGASGHFKEVDQQSPACRCGEATLSGAKYDYVFLSADDWNNLDGDATSSPISDHDPLRGWGTLKTP
jgi:endonuclease/exonuclease/phosphatase family metal-dependent hydrolase